MNINETAKAIHKNARDKGFWDEHDGILSKMKYEPPASLRRTSKLWRPPSKPRK